MNIRQATVEDSHRIAEIVVAGWRTAYRGLVSDVYLDTLSIEKRTASLRAYVQTSPEETLVCLENNEVRGFIGFGRCRDPESSNHGEIYLIYVDPNHWGKGYGRALMSHAEAILWKRSIAAIELWVFEENHTTRKFYEKNGYQTDGGRKIDTMTNAGLWVIRYRKTGCENE